ncbi:AAA family ATPase [Candidatus Kaiserbacteria bacterium RIFCSPHIGHO2_02_FULL_55_17]|uniref:AAA family ATPase n=1 Tax=Candidatus Kaiserbacteria bacterium RIFCSPHIGHO2_02_FULL_55_17 TaxID=1798496 RepID=A0A1F6DS14_9BACT|nr:MAG: AAA family ATPase [Candidatus Kaiserbacteria bacterium RIFCSPHIGHO2_02_FULL_55_17]
MEPLAARIRPEKIEDVVGQEHLVGPGSPSKGLGAGPLRVAIEKKHLFSFILWGPPGTGKTTIARIYARALDAELFELSAVSAGKDDIRKIISKDTHDRGKLLIRPRVLFLDEIHRFNKAQQDFLLPYVESGELTLIGATTENPSFEVISPLLSRCRVFVLEPLSEEALRAIVKRTKLKVNKDAFDWLLGYSNGDARKALGMLEGATSLYGSVSVDTLNKALESPHLRYDKKGEEHYDTISACIKSMRASQPDAALYYLARMVEAGEDPLFIARRMVVFASEDVGLAQPTALVVANAVFRACETIGYPECAINLAHGVAYLAQAKKDRSAYDALRTAQADVHAFGNLPVPKKIRNPVTKLMEELEYGKGYEKYSQESYLPDKLKKKKYLK